LYGVRRGLIADIDRPLPAGQQNLRSSTRVRTSFEIILDGNRRRVTGNVSAGGVMFLLAKPLIASSVEVVLPKTARSPEIRAVAHLLACHAQGPRVAHRACFSKQANRAEINRFVDALIAEDKLT
jgi:hypothetical protein